MMKAYDTVNWIYLVNVMRSFDFGECWIDMVWTLISNPWFWVLINGFPCGFLRGQSVLVNGLPCGFLRGQGNLDKETPYPLLC